MTIQVTVDYTPFGKYVAILPDRYDGAPDAGPVTSAIGYGDTRTEAITDLLEQVEEE
jgi:hypothetical protein